MRPDAIPVRAVASRAELPPRLAGELFGTELRDGERIGLARRGEVQLYVYVVAGDAPRLALDALDADALGAADGVRLVGPVGSAPAPAPTSVTSCLVLPEGLRGAWRIPPRATLGLGGLAAEVEVVTGPAAELLADRGLWVAAGRPDVARWLPGVELAHEMAPPARDDRTVEVDGRVFTETDVRQARLRHRRIVLRAEQIVTPGARDLAREWDVFSEG